jgi:putative transcription factor
MVQCEMCGAETGSPKTVKVEGAELDVCEDCTDFGTEVREDPSSSASTKYSTSSSDSGDSSGTTTRSSGGRSGGSSGGGSRGSEMMDDVEALATDYDERIRAAREDAGLSQEELAGELNEKASLIRKLERGDMLPSDELGI